MLSAITDRGLVRTSNQDAAAAVPLTGGAALLVVADGVGGHPGGEVASALAVEAVLARFASPDGPPPDPPERALRDAFALAQRRIRDRQDGRLAWMSTTLVAALVRGDAAWVANVGDSRGYLHGRDGLRQVTLDHSWVEEQIRAGRLAHDDPRVAAHRNLITRSVGGDEALDVDVFGPLAIVPGDALLLCSDGLHGMVPDAEVDELLRGGGERVTERLVARALAHGGADNVAVALYVPPPRGG